MNENKYHSTIRMEFRDLIDNLVESKRKTFHMYTIHRILSLGLLIDFSFQYVEVPEPEKQIGIELDLKEYGKVVFIVDVKSNYVRIANENYKETLKRFLENFDTCLQKQPKKRIF